MTEIIWVKCTEKYMITDYSTDPPTVREGIYSESVYDEERDIMFNKGFYEDGKIKRLEEVYDDKQVEIEYDKNGNQVSKNTVEFDNPDEDYMNERVTYDDGTVVEEKGEFDNEDRLIKKYFLENRKIISYLEFDCDNEDQLKETRLFEGGEFKGKWEHFYKDGKEVKTIEYDPSGNIIEISELELNEDGKSFSIRRLDRARRLISRIYEIVNDKGKVVEQRIFNESDKLKEQKIFGPDNEYGDRLQHIEREYEGGKLKKENVTKYEYEY